MIQGTRVTTDLKGGSGRGTGGTRVKKPRESSLAAFRKPAVPKIPVDQYKAHTIRRYIRLVPILKSLCNSVARRVCTFVVRDDKLHRHATNAESPVDVDGED